MSKSEQDVREEARTLLHRLVDEAWKRWKSAERKRLIEFVVNNTEQLAGTEDAKRALVLIEHW